MLYWQNHNLKNYPGERWKDIPICKGKYQASNFGRIKRLERLLIRFNNRPQYFKEMIMSQLVEHHGYLRVGIIDNSGKQKLRKAHVLIALAWKPNPHNKPYINNKKGIKTDNRPHQIEWATHAENIRHAIKHKLWGSPRKGEENNFTTISSEKAMAIYKTKLPNQLAAKHFNVSHNIISDIKIGKSWSHLTGQKRIRTKRLPDDVVLDIFNSNLSYTEIAKRHSIERNAVGAIKSGLYYSKVTGKKYKPMGCDYRLFRKLNPTK